MLCYTFQYLLPGRTNQCDIVQENYGTDKVPQQDKAEKELPQLSATYHSEQLTHHFQ
jgi:hypothetical protein